MKILALLLMLLPLSALAIDDEDDSATDSGIAGYSDTMSEANNGVGVSLFADNSSSGFGAEITLKIPLYLVK